MPEEVVFRLQYVGRSRELCLRSTKYVYVFIGAYYPPSMQYYVSYVVMLLERQPWCYDVQSSLSSA